MPPLIQSCPMSLLEAVTNTLVGYLLAVATQLLIFPCFDLPARIPDALAMGAVFTLVSVGRSFVVRRQFERWRHART